jgi:hypothetical protein
MGRLRRSLILQLLFALTCLSRLHAQASASAPVETGAAAATTTATAQAPDDTTKKLTELVHAGKYTEAQKLTTGLLVAYPNDQRLLKAKELIDKLLAPASSENATPGSSQPVQSVANSNAEQLTGMDKVDYNALIVLARQAKQTTDLDKQTNLLEQFMDQSTPFLQKHPEQMLLWQLRGASAISLNEPMEGYEAGQKLLAAGAADSTDPNAQILLAQLKNKGWLDQTEVERQKKFGWILGTWTVHCDFKSLNKGGTSGHTSDLTIDFSMLDSVVEGHYVSEGSKLSTPFLRSTISDKGEIGWERYHGGGWHPITFQISSDKRSIRFTDRVSWTYRGKNWSADEAYTLDVSSRLGIFGN